MKKYLLGLLSIPLGLIAFSSANNLNVSCEEDEDGNSLCNPFYITLNKNSCENGISQITLSNFSCEFPEGDEDQPCGISLITPEGTNYFNIAGNIEDDCNVDNDNTQFEVHTYAGVGSFNGTLIIQGNTGGNEGGNTGGDEGGNTGGDSGGSSVGSLLPGGEIALSGAISGLTSTINEFIPLMVYVGLGVLGAVIGFFAIKWLIAYVRKEVFTIFKK